MHEPVFILGNHKSGTTLLTRLFDGHPDYFVLPFETHVFGLIGEWIPYQFFKQLLIPFLSTDDKLCRLDDHFTTGENENLYLDLKSLNIVMNNRVFSIAQFLDELYDHSTVDIIERYFRAIYRSFYQKMPPENIHYMEKSTDHYTIVNTIAARYYDAKFIHVLRNPYANLVSFRRHTIRTAKSMKQKSFLQKLFFGPNRAYPLMQSMALAIRDSFLAAYQNQLLFNHRNYFVVKYEQLVAEPEITMKKLCEFLDIDYHSSLLKPTLLGQSWKGNSSRDFLFDSISDRNVGLWRQEITLFEQYIINKLIGSAMERFGYKIKSTPRLARVLLPARNEWGLTWIANRAMLVLNGLR